MAGRIRIELKLSNGVQAWFEREIDAAGVAIILAGGVESDGYLRGVGQSAANALVDSADVIRSASSKTSIGVRRADVGVAL